MKHIVISLFIALFTISPICSQNGNDSDELKKLRIERDRLQLENDNLKRELNTEKENYTTLESAYEDFKKSYNELKKATDTKEFEKLQKDLNNKTEELEKLKTQKTELEQEKKNINKALKDTVTVLNKAKKTAETNLKNANSNLENKENALNKAKQDLDNEKKTTVKLRQQVGRLQGDSAKLVSTLTENSNLKKELDELKAFKLEWLRELAQRVDQEWLNKKYSQIDLAQIEQAYDQYSKYSVDDPMVAEAKNKMTPLVEGYRIYNKAMEAINAPYDEALTKVLLPKLNDLCDREQDPAQKDELKALARILGNYELNVGLFQDLKNGIDTQISELGDGTTHRMAYPLVKDVLKTFEEDGTIEAIEEVPYLKKTLEEYKKALNEDCIKCYKIELKLTK